MGEHRAAARWEGRGVAPRHVTDHAHGFLTHSLSTMLSFLQPTGLDLCGRCMRTGVTK